MHVRQRDPAERLAGDLVQQVVALGCSAPSIGNSQPWRWRLRPGPEPAVDLHADPARRLTDRDPDGRQLLISCGAALHQARTGAHALGWSTEVERLSLEGDGLARLRLAPASVPLVPASTLVTLAERCTDRRRFTAWPVPHDVLAGLAAAGRRPGVQALPVVTVTGRFRAGLLADRALAPGELMPADGLLVLATTDDAPHSWLAAGEALAAVWLAATRAGLAVVPLSAPVEDAGVRDALRREVLGDRLLPQLLLRVGWQALGRHQLERTSRRPLADVLSP